MRNDAVAAAAEAPKQPAAAAEAQKQPAAAAEAQKQPAAALAKKFFFVRADKLREATEPPPRMQALRAFGDWLVEQPSAWTTCCTGRGGNAISS